MKVGVVKTLSKIFLSPVVNDIRDFSIELFECVIVTGNSEYFNFDRFRNNIKEHENIFKYS